jgi:hypothetical protein
MYCPNDNDKIIRQAQEQNEYNLRRWREFRLTAEYLACALSEMPQIRKIAIFGSVARQPEKEQTHFRKYRKIGADIYHYCKDIDMAVWLDTPASLRQIQRIISRTVKQLCYEGKSRIAHHQVDVFFVEPGTNKYMGRLCKFSSCPKKDKLKCKLTPNCGQIPLLEQHQDFVMNPDHYDSNNTIILFDRDNKDEGKFRNLIRSK